MEQSDEVEANNQKSDCRPLSKHLGSLIRIDAISIDLASAMDNHQDANKCDHFSLRGYVAEMRNKNIDACLPFSNEEIWHESEEKNSVLPPLEVVKFKWWSCHNCLGEIGAACCTQEIEKISDSSPIGIVSKGSCSTTELVKPSCTEVNINKSLTSFCVYDDKQKKDTAGDSISDGSGNDLVVKDIVNSKTTLVQDRHGNGPDAMEFQAPSFRKPASSDIRHLENNGNNLSEIAQTDSNSANIQQRIEIMNNEIISKLSYTSIGNIEVTKKKASVSRSADDLSSESGDIYFNKYNHDKLNDKLTKSVPQRAPKIRFLTEILGSGGNNENDKSKTTDSDSDSASDFCDDMTAHKMPQWHSKGKRKINQAENGIPLLLPKSPKLSKGVTNFAKRNCMVVYSDTEESSGTFDRQKSVNNCMSDKNKNKNKKIQHESGYPITVPRPDVAKKYNYALTEGGPSKPAHSMYNNYKMDINCKSPISPSQAELKSNMSKKKNKQFGVWQAVPAPQRNTIPSENSSIKKDSDGYGRKSVNLSLNSYEVSHRNEENNIAKSTIGFEPLSLSWNNTVREHCHQEKNIFRDGESSEIHKSAQYLNSGKGLLYDLNEKMDSQPSIRNMQNGFPQFGKGSVQHRRELTISDTRNREPKNYDQDGGDDDIPMEIVELMAKNQYDRRQHEAKINYFSHERTNEKRKFESMGLPRVYGNGVLKKSYQVDDNSMRTHFSGLTTVKSSEHVAPRKINPINPFSYINETSHNMTNMEGKKSAFVRCGSFFDSQGTQSGRVSYPYTGFVINNKTHNFQRESDHIEGNFSPLKVKHSLIPNNTNFPQKYEPQASYFGTNSQIPEPSSRAKNAKIIDLNFVKEKYNCSEKQNRDFGFKSFGKSSAVHPFALDNRGIDLNASVSDSLDLNCNEAIPAMQLLSLMDSGLKSSIGKQKIISKPFSACSYHPKVLDKPSFSSDNRSKDPFGRAIGVSSNGSKPSSSSSYYKSQWRDNSSCECPPPIPTFNLFSSLINNEGNVTKVGNGVPTRFSSKFEVKKKGHSQISRGKIKNSLQNSHDFNSIRSNKRGPQYVSGSFFSSQSIPSSEICFVNRNPADFSIPERGNIYMINGRDLKFGNNISLKGKNGLVKIDGKKRQKVTVLTAIKT